MENNLIQNLPNFDNLEDLLKNCKPFYSFDNNHNDKVIDGIIQKDLYNFYHSFKLKDWIDESKLDFTMLSSNPNAMYLLERNPEKINWSEMSGNPSAMHLLEKNPDKINWERLSWNKSAIYLLSKNKDKIDWMSLGGNNHPLVQKLFSENVENFKYEYWTFLVTNECAMDLIELNIESIPWCRFSKNKNPRAIKLLEQNPNKIDWFWLSENPGAIELLEKNLDASKAGLTTPHLGEVCKINWYNLVNNEAAMHIIEENMDKFCGFAIFNLSANKGAINYLEKNQNKIYWSLFSRNESIFELDYEFFFNRMNIIRQELMEKTWHPDRYRDWGLSIEELN